MHKVSIEVNKNETPEYFVSSLILSIDGEIYISCWASSDELKLFNLETGNRYSDANLRDERVKEFLKFNDAVLIDCKEIVIK